MVQFNIMIIHAQASDLTTELNINTTLLLAYINITSNITFEGLEAWAIRN